MDIEDYIETRNSLISKDLLAFDGTLFQVLELPPTAPARLARRTDAYDAL
jgi:hypothetical protein